MPAFHFLKSFSCLKTVLPYVLFALCLKAVRFHIMFLLAEPHNQPKLLSSPRPSLITPPKVAS